MVLGGWSFWCKGVLLAAVYGAGYFSAWYLSVDQFYLPAGLRVAAVLLFAPRWWPFLIIGEAAGILTLRIPQADQYGIPFVVVSSITMMPLTIALYRLLPKKLLESDEAYWFLPFALASAITTAAVNSVMVYGLMKAVRSGIDWNSTAALMVGMYQGILTIAPLAILRRLGRPTYPFPGPFARNASLAAAFCALICMFVFIFPQTISDGRNILRVGLIIPAVALTLVHGWRGAAVGVATACMAIGFTIHHTDSLGSHDPISFSAQLVLALGASTLLLVGSSLTRHYEKARQRGFEKYQALAFARSCFTAGDRETKRLVDSMGNVGDAVYTELLAVAKRLHDLEHHKLAMEIQNQAVTRSKKYKLQMHLLYPSEIERVGLYSCLLNSPLSESWSKYSAIDFRLRGDSESLSTDLQVMTYRVVSDILSFLATAGHQELIVTARCGQRARNAGIAIKVALPRGEAFNDYVQQVADFDITGRVKVCGGKIRRRTRYIWLLMREPISIHAIRHGALMRSTDQLVKPSGTV